MNREKSCFTVLRWINSVTGKAKCYIAILIILQVCLGAGGIFSAILMRELVNAAVDGCFSRFFRAALWFSGIVLVQILLRAAARFFDEYAKATIENQFKHRLFLTLLNKDYAKVTKLHSGEWLNRMTQQNDIGYIGGGGGSDAYFAWACRHDSKNAGSIGGDFVVRTFFLMDSDTGGSTSYIPVFDS